MRVEQCRERRSAWTLSLDSTIAWPPRRTAVCGCAVTRLITSVSWTFQPIRAHASVTEDTCGSTLTCSGPNSRISVPPMPCSSGSPLATTWTSSAWRSREGLQRGQHR